MNLGTEVCLIMSASGQKRSWSSTYLLHSTKAMKKYEKYLGMDLRDVVEPVVPKAKHRWHGELPKASPTFGSCNLFKSVNSQTIK